MIVLKNIFVEVYKFIVFALQFWDMVFNEISFVIEKILKHIDEQEFYNSYYWKLRIRNMEPREFEEFCADLLEAMGYKAILTPATGDGGKDIILYRNGHKVYVECKHFGENNYVGREICQKLIGACVSDGVHRGIIITTGRFSSSAWEIKKKTNRLEFWTLDTILRQIRKLQRDEIRRLGYEWRTDKLLV